MDVRVCVVCLHACVYTLYVYVDELMCACVCMYMWCGCVHVHVCVYNVHGDRHTCACLPVVLYMLRTCMIFSPCHQTLVSAWALTAAASFVW